MSEIVYIAEVDADFPPTYRIMRCEITRSQEYGTEMLTLRSTKVLVGESRDHEWIRFSPDQHEHSQDLRVFATLEAALLWAAGRVDEIAHSYIIAAGRFRDRFATECAEFIPINDEAAVTDA